MNVTGGWADDLRRAYPWFPKEVFCGTGWAYIIKDLCRRIQAFLDTHEDYRKEFYVTQCKQKYGHLMFYAFPERDEIEKMVDDAASMAGSTCEVCGAPGTFGSEKISGGRSWVVVRCENCRKN